MKPKNQRLVLVVAAIVAVLTFVGHHRLPYKRMLIFTGALLVFVLIMMVGEQVAEMQLAGWVGTTEIGWLQWLPEWAGLWFSLFPNVETLAAQGLAVTLVLGSYALSRYQAVSLPKRRGLAPFAPRWVGGALGPLAAQAIYGRARLQDAARAYWHRRRPRRLRPPV